MSKKVVLLAAGTGRRMGKYADVTNKALLPIADKAIISHIIEQFEEPTHFIVAVGYKKELVRAYLSLAHSDRKITFVDVGDYGEGTGPATSLLACKDYLGGGAFTVVACDAYYTDIDYLPNRSVITIAKVLPELATAYCNVEVVNSRVVAIHDKQECPTGFVMSGVLHVKQSDTEEFWDSLSGTELSSGWKNLNVTAVEKPWVDLGTFDQYQKFYLQNSPYDFSKTDEFLYIVNGRVIKWFKNAKVAKNRVARALMVDGVFPTIENVEYIEDGFYSYRFVAGKTLYESCDLAAFKKFLDRLSHDVWGNSMSKTLLKSQCQDFYVNKTIERLAAFKKKYPNFNPKTINGKIITKTFDDILKHLDWGSIVESMLEYRSGFIHGDLQFDNVIFDGDKFTFLDWRQDFGGSLDVGDIIYDIAKLKGGLLLNYDLIKKNQFKYEEVGDDVVISHTPRSIHAEFLAELNERFYNEFIDDVVTIIFLNMAPLHTPPFDKFLYCLALERLNEPK